MQEVPTMEVTLAVYGSDKEEEEEETDKKELSQEQTTKASPHQVPMQLIRIVNHIPLLDSAEGIACGLVQGVIAQDSVWQSVGLDVSLSTTSGGTTNASLLRVPTFGVKDSHQVLPFLKSQRTPFDDGDDDDGDEKEKDESDNDSDNESLDQIIVQYQHRRSRKRRHRAHRRRLPQTIFLPADARLGKILLVVHIHAKPSQLPLPTLCKGRIPQDNQAIHQALQVGLRNCLRQLQGSNPGLFLTAKELRVVERKVCFVPLLSNAMASILQRSTSEHTQRAKQVVQSWKDDFSCEEEENEEEESSSQEEEEEEANHHRIQDMSRLLRNRLEMILVQPPKKPVRRRGSSTSLCHPEKDSDNDCKSDDDDDLEDLLHASSWGTSNHKEQVENNVAMANQQEDDNDEDDSYVDML
jgi:hypothetical protein